MHFAGLKAVGESVEQPMRYFRNNVEGSMNLLECMGRSGCRSLVFSSSCTVYGASEKVPTDESASLSAVNPYGRSKLMVEDICRDLARSEKGWKIALLRYFNPIGAHPSGDIGEDPLGVPNGLLPYLLQVAVGRRPFLRVFGNDYPTEDGTGVRDFIHVVDLVAGHIKALERLAGIEGCLATNLGTGRGHSVLEAVSALSQPCGKELPFQLPPRPAVDIAQISADPTLAVRPLAWKAERICGRCARMRGGGRAATRRVTARSAAPEGKRRGLMGIHRTLRPASPSAWIAIFFIVAGLYQMVFFYRDNRYVHVLALDIVTKAHADGSEARVIALRDYLRTHINNDGLSHDGSGRHFCGTAPAQTLRSGKGLCGEVPGHLSSWRARWGYGRSG